jgi:hypothetical protein
VIGQAAKGFADAYAVTTSLDYRVLRHRARPVSERDRMEWQNVWNAANSIH